MELLNRVILGNSIKNYILFIAILIVGLAFKRFFSRSINKLLFGIVGGFKRSPNTLTFLSLLLHPVELLITFSVCYLAINQLDYPLNEVVFSRRLTIDHKILHDTVSLINIIDKIFLLLFIISITWIVIAIIDCIAYVSARKASRSKSKANAQIVPFLKELGKIVAIIIGIFVIMGAVFEVNVPTMIAGLGVGGIAIALAAKDTLQNLLGSFTIFVDKPFVIGDSVRIDKYEGTIEKVGFRSTLLRTIDKTLVVIPNGKMIDSPLENLTLRNLRRMTFNLGLQYDTPISSMTAISKEIEAYINKHQATTTTHKDTIVRFDSFGEYSLNLLVRYYIEIVDYAEYMQIREEINYKIMEIVARYGASFAFPSQTVYQYPVNKIG